MSESPQPPPRHDAIAAGLPENRAREVPFATPADVTPGDAPLADSHSFRAPSRRSSSWLQSPRVWILVGTHLLCLLFGVLASRALWPGPGSRVVEELRIVDESQWARKVAEHFLDAFAGERAEEVRAVSTRNYQARIQVVSITGGPMRWSINSQDTAPNQDQASIKGILEFQTAQPGENRRSFTLLMEKENGRWKVSSFSQGPYLR